VAVFTQQYGCEHIAGPSAWAAVDLLFFLPEIPMTYIGEHYGWRVTIDINTGNFKVLRCLSSLYLYFCLCLYVFPIFSFSSP
jgi:hypothetical protein